MIIQNVISERGVSFSEAGVAEVLVEPVPHRPCAFPYVRHISHLRLANFTTYLIHSVFGVTFAIETVIASVALFVTGGARGFRKGRSYQFFLEGVIIGPGWFDRGF